MAGVKRPLSTRATTLAARASPYHDEVTLFEFDADSASPRRSKRVKREPEVEGAIDSVVKKGKAVKVETTASASSTPRKAGAKSPRKPKPIQQALEVPHPAPPKWQETYNMIKEMRSRIEAPVDTMGCQQAQFKETEPKNMRFATLISLMLSSQTKDEVTDAAVSKLRAALGGSLTVDASIAADDKTISEAINKVGFWRKKTEHIKKAAQRLRDDFDSDVPKTVDELCSLAGVGPKMAFLTLHAAWNLNVGIGVDVHVHRITNRLGWHKPPTKTPEETRLNLQSWLPMEYHREINHMLVGFGQTICSSPSPRCDMCDLSTAGLCPSAQKVSTSKVRKGVILTPKATASDSPPKLEIELEGEEEKPVLYTIPDPPAKTQDEVKLEEAW
ncbi:DNA glycosylase [Lyophyllum atratum]|nr:DNA glycosylase [Lyophyllum atratum]